MQILFNLAQESLVKVWNFQTHRDFVLKEIEQYCGREVEKNTKELSEAMAAKQGNLDGLLNIFLNIYVAQRVTEIIRQVTYTLNTEPTEQELQTLHIEPVPVNENEFVTPNTEQEKAYSER